MRYIDEAFSGPALMPSTPAERVRVNQLMSIVDSYGYPASITNIFIPRVLVPSLGGQTDEAQVEAAKPQAALFLTEIDRLLGGANYFGGDTVSLADLHLLPGADLPAGHPGRPAGRGDTEHHGVDGTHEPAQQRAGGDAERLTPPRRKWSSASSAQPSPARAARRRIDPYSARSPTPD